MKKGKTEANEWGIIKGKKVSINIFSLTLYEISPTRWGVKFSISDRVKVAR